MQEKSEKSDGRVDCDHVSGLYDAAPCPLAQMGSAIQPQAMKRPRKPRHGTGSLDRRFDRSSSHSALAPRHRRTVRRQAAPRVIVTQCRLGHLAVQSRPGVRRRGPALNCYVTGRPSCCGGSRCRCRTVHFPPRHQRPCHPSHLVGQRHGYDLTWLALQKSLQPLCH